MKYRTFKVDWETDGENVDLPQTVKVSKEVDDNEVADVLSDEYGWLVSSLEEL